MSGLKHYINEALSAKEPIERLMNLEAARWIFENYKNSTLTAREKKDYDALTFTVITKLPSGLWLSTEDVDEDFKIPLSIQAKLRKYEGLPFSKWGTRIMYKKAELEAFLGNK